MHSFGINPLGLQAPFDCLLQ